MSLTDLIPTLQLAVGPVILISGVGLILLSMTNRFGRVIDRSRILTEDSVVRRLGRGQVMAQLKILARRARIIRMEIALVNLSVLLAAILIISLFLGVLLELGMATLIVFLFVLCMLCLIASLVLFMSDIGLSLKALWLELPPEARSDARSDPVLSRASCFARYPTPPHHPRMSRSPPGVAFSQIRP